MSIHSTNNRLKLAGFVAGLALTLLSVGCATTQLERAWVKPDLAPLNLRRVVAIALSRNPTRRRIMEASIVEQIRKVSPDVQTTQSSTLISDADVRNEERVREQLQGAGFDAWMIMRVTDVARNDVYVPGEAWVVPEYYRTFWGYYRHWIPISYEPGYVERDRDVQVETALYSATSDGELVYSAISRTLNPNSSADLAKDVTSLVARDLRDKGILPARNEAAAAR
jgi:hypothetical protein